MNPVKVLQDQKKAETKIFREHGLNFINKMFPKDNAFKTDKNAQTHKKQFF